jgi:DnaD/phage-associated family protein
MDKWLNDYRLDISIIVEACERTIAQINKAEMRYTDTILETWAKEGIHTLSDVAALDQKRPSKQVVSKSNLPSSNKFSNYNQRSYDYEELEKKALELRLKEFNGKRYSS